MYMPDTMVTYVLVRGVKPDTMGTIVLVRGVNRRFVLLAVFCQRAYIQKRAHPVHTDQTSMQHPKLNIVNCVIL